MSASPIDRETWPGRVTSRLRRLFPSCSASSNRKMNTLKRFAAAFLLSGALFPHAVAAAEANPASGGGKELASVYATLKAGTRVETGAAPAAAAAKEPTVYLTFDDGPGKLTPEVLDILRKEEIKATFFMIGELVRSHPETVKRVLKEGHAVGNHSYDHSYKKLYSSFGGFWTEVKNTESAFTEVAGVRPALLRAPGGTYTNFDAFYYDILERAGYRIYDWNVDSGDASRRGVPAAEIATNVRKSPLKNEMVVLMHDGGDHRETVKALPQIIRFYKEKGYRFAPLTDRVQPIQFRIGKIKWNRSMGYEEYVRYVSEAVEHAAHVAAKETAADRTDRSPLSGGAQKEKPKTTDEKASADQAGDVGKDSVGTVGKDGSGGLENGPDREGADGESGKTTGQTSVTDTAKEAGSGGVQPVTERDNGLERLTSLPLNVWLGEKLWTLPGGAYELSDGRLNVPVAQLAERMGGRALWNAETMTARIVVGLRVLEYDLAVHSVRAFRPGAGWTEHPLVPMNLRNGELWSGLRTAVELSGAEIAGYSFSANGWDVLVRPLPFTLPAFPKVTGSQV